MKSLDRMLSVFEVKTSGMLFIRYQGQIYVLKWCKQHGHAVWVEYPSLGMGSLFQCGNKGLDRYDMEYHDIVSPDWEHNWEFEFLD